MARWIPSGSLLVPHENRDLGAWAVARHPRIRGWSSARSLPKVGTMTDTEVNKKIVDEFIKLLQPG
jgi:hypothetical protein